jgi:thiol-disulfide isomerase/thioredoxin
MNTPELRIERWFNSPAPLTLQALRGRVVVLHFFQMLCPGCVAHAIPQAIRLARLLPREQVAVLGVHSVFEHHAAMLPAALEVFLHEYRIEFPVGVDQHTEPDGAGTPATMTAYALRGTPSVVLIDRGGEVQLNHFGHVDDLALGAMIGQLMGPS